LKEKIEVLSNDLAVATEERDLLAKFSEEAIGKLSTQLLARQSEIDKLRKLNLELVTDTMPVFSSVDEVYRTTSGVTDGRRACSNPEGAQKHDLKPRSYLFDAVRVSLRDQIVFDDIDL
jgi:hypothetical protein